MKKQKMLAIEQLDRKFEAIRIIEKIIPPEQGWINSVRTAIGMSLKQMGIKLGISIPSAKGLERRERNGSITINSLKKAADKLEMKLVYGFVPKGESLEKMIEEKAYEAAKKIVMRTAVNMQLEDQGNSQARLEREIKNKAEEIKKELPKFLWD
ncbi:MAG: mobile mystery protein A [Spirochaetes bacterium]|nr:mobile mystery protein A [Spirochaetota bacterium]